MSSTSNKRAIKRKIDESVLKKARAALGLPLNNEDNDQEDPELSLKWRKPRHNTTEGQLYVKNKEKRKKLELEAPNQSTSMSPSGLRSSHSKKVDKLKSKKKRRKKKSKKSGNTDSSDVGKNPESEQRHRMDAISYLQLWAANRDHWKFEKLKQTWLLKNCLSLDLMDDKCFEMFVEYVGSIKGAAKKATLVEMKNVVSKFETHSDSNQGDPPPTTITKEMYDRARQLLQMFEDD